MSVDGILRPIRRQKITFIANIILGANCMHSMYVMSDVVNDDIPA